MKKLISTIAILVFAVIFTNDVQAQKFPKLDKSPADIVLHPRRAAEKTYKIVYSRPQLDGRSLDELAPKGKVWRTGANEATQITFYKDVTFGGKAVKAGTYSLFTIPGDKAWTIILNSATNGWGAFGHNEKKDVARVSGAVSKSEKSIEAFTIMADRDKLLLGWGTTVVTVTVK
ncbi:MAG: DUF2911 domain-containing protein [Flavobacteriaceae bacterium]